MVQYFLTKHLWYLEFALPEEIQQGAFGIAWGNTSLWLHCVYISGPERCRLSTNLAEIAKNPCLCVG